jgi:hypothetical protein
MGTELGIMELYVVICGRKNWGRGVGRKGRGSLQVQLREGRKLNEGVLWILSGNR